MKVGNDSRTLVGIRCVFIANSNAFVALIASSAIF